MKQYLHLSLIAMISGLVPANAQPKQGQARLDSLLAELPKMKEDTNKVKLLKSISFQYSHIDPATGVKYADAGLNLSRKLNWARGYSALSATLGINYFMLGDYANSLKEQFDALKFDEDRGDERGAETDCNAIAMVYDREGKIEKAIEYNNRALAIDIRRKDTSNMAMMYSNLGENFKSLHRYREAIDLYRKSLDMSAKIADDEGIENTMTDLGDALAGIRHYDSAILFLDKGLAIKTQQGNKQEVALSRNSLGDFYTALAKDLSANNQAASYPPGVDRMAAINLAAYNYNEAVAIASLIGYNDMLQTSLAGLSEAQAMQGNYKGALASYQQSIGLRDSVFNIANNEKITNLETRRALELKNKDLQIARLSHDKRRNERAFFITGLLGLALVAGFVIRQSTLRKRANNQLAISNKQLDEANRIKARFFGILSHDLRTPIANLATYLHLQREAPEIMDEASKAAHQETIETAANNLLSVMEDLLLWSKGQMTSFKPEIKSIGVLTLFHEIKKLLPAGLSTDVVFDDPGLLHIDTDENFLKTIMRNLTANALKAIGNQSGGKVAWKAWEEGGKKYLSITDNGPGLSKEQVENLFAESAVTSSKTGLGLHIVRDFAQMLGQKIEVKSTPGQGTSFILSNIA